DGQGTYNVYGTGAPLCGLSGSTSGAAITGTATTTYVAGAPVDADPPAPPTRIFACTTQDAQLLGFTPPTLPTTQQFVEGMAVVGTHLLVFTSRF
ncbi:MAG TPA: hypothetical protein VGF46_04585, partial [Gaiellales bacterium]